MSVTLSRTTTHQYDGDEELPGRADRGNQPVCGANCRSLQKAERAKNGVLDMETEVVTSLTAYGPGYIDEELKDLEQVVGLQTDKPLKRAFMPYGGIKMAEESCRMYGYEPSEKIHEIFTKYHKTHNQAVFDVYTPEMKVCKSQQNFNRSSGYLRTWTYRWRLPSSSSVRYRSADRVQEQKDFDAANRRAA